MGRSEFSSFMDRSRIDWLEHEIALVALDLLRTYVNEPNHCIANDHVVNQAFLRAGQSVYDRQFFSFNAVNDIILAVGQRLLSLVRQEENNAGSDHGPVAQEIADGPDKVRASVDEIETEIIALCTRFEDQGYRPCEIGRALVRVGLTFAPVSFIERKVGYFERDLIGRADREREFLDAKLGGDRYGKDKGTRH